MIFSDSPQQRALERMMTTVPRFRPKGGGLMVLHRFEYTTEICNCRYCPYYRGKRKCAASHCPCIEERILVGAATRAEVMAETMKDIHNPSRQRQRTISRPKAIGTGADSPSRFPNKRKKTARKAALSHQRNK